MRMIIVGASGSMGQSLYEACQTEGMETWGTYYNRKTEGLLPFDMRSGRLGAVIPGGLRPDDTVFLLSAYSNIGWVYTHQEEARRLNLEATQRLIDEIADAGARVIFMSTVDVFDGQEGYYKEHSRPNPLTYYGRLKLDIEKYLFQKKCRSCIVRIAWRVSWDIQSSCVIKFTYQTLMAPGAKMAQDSVLTLVDVRDLCEGMLRISERPEVSICHLGSFPAVVRTDLAKMIMTSSKYGRRMSFQTAVFKDIPYSEKRSRDVSLDSSFAVSVLGMKFRPPQDIIREKIALLDRYMDVDGKI